MKPDVDDIKKQIINKSNTSNLPIKLIAIDGHGGAGKTTLATKLGKELGAEVIHQDDFASSDNPLNWWPRVIREIFTPIQNGATTLSYKPSSWWPDHHPEHVELTVTPIMILEGASSARKEFREYISYAIWVETPRDVCLKRGLERDGKDALQQWQKWLADEDEYINRDNPQSFADTTVSGQ